MKGTRTCSVEGCERQYRCSGFCELHYSRWLKTGKVEIAQRPATPPCAVSDCDRPSRCRGYCDAHYSRVRKHGHPQEDVPLKGMPKRSERGDIVARIMSKTERSESGCLVFTGEISHSGYGRISWASKSWVAHRAMWTALVGPIPEALAPDGSIWTIDHLCSNRACVNVGHLEMVSLIENTRRGGGITKAWAKNRSKPKKHYPHGTNERYTARRCRCDECRRAHAAYIRAVRNRHKESNA